MEGVASNNTLAVIKNCPVFAGRNKELFQEYEGKLRVCLSLYSKAVFEVFEGKAQPSSTLGSTDTAMPNANAEHKWLQANQNLWSVLLLTTSGSADNTVKKSEGKRPEDGAGHGQMEWKALTEKYNGHTKEARRACHEKLVNTKMEAGQDPGGFFVILDECRDLLEEMGQTIRNERYEGITASHERRDLGLDDARHMVHTIYADNLSRFINAMPIAGPGIVMQVVGHTSSDAQCNYCKGFGHVTQYCAILKKEHRRGSNPGGPQHQ